MDAKSTKDLDGHDLKLNDGHRHVQLSSSEEVGIRMKPRLLSVTKFIHIMK